MMPGLKKMRGMEKPRCYRERYKPPRTFLGHIDFSSPSRQPGLCTFANPNLDQSKNQHSPLHSEIQKTETMQNGPTSLHHRHKGQTNDSLGRVTNHVISKLRKMNWSNISHSQGSPSKDKSTFQAKDKTSCEYNSVGMKWNRDRSFPKYSPEYSLLLSSSPDEIRDEVDLLFSDLIVRLKQLLFNSLLCAYYVGFIPVQFADSHLHYDKWWCTEHVFLVWANSFVILSAHLLPPSYCQILYQCSLHLGYWTRCTHNENAQIWSPSVIWLHDMVVQWNGESFRAEGPRNVAIPCDSSQECFYLLFHSRLLVHTWLLTLQCITVAFQIVVLLRSVFWFQILSMSVFLVFNYFILYKLLYNRLWYGKSFRLLE